MYRNKGLVYCSLFATGIFGSATPALAFDYWVGSTGTVYGTSTVTAPTNALYNALSEPCSASFTVQVTSGSASVTAASFSGSGSCATITACNLPWSMGRPLAAAGVANNVKITGVCLHFGPPLNQTCTGTLNGTLSATGTMTFAGTLTASPGPGVCTFTTRSPGTTSPVLGIE